MSWKFNGLDLLYIGSNFSARVQSTIRTIRISKQQLVPSTEPWEISALPRSTRILNDKTRQGPASLHCKSRSAKPGLVTGFTRSATDLLTLPSREANPEYGLRVHVAHSDGIEPRRLSLRIHAFTPVKAPYLPHN